MRSTRIILITWIFLTHFFQGFFSNRVLFVCFLNIMGIKTHWVEYIDRPKLNQMSGIPKYQSVIHPYPSELRIIQYQMSLQYWAIYSIWIKYRRWWDPAINGSFLNPYIFIHQVLATLKWYWSLLSLPHSEAYRLFINHWHWIRTQCHINTFSTSYWSPFSEKEKNFLSNTTAVAKALIAKH